MNTDLILTSRRDPQSEPDSGDEILRRIASAISGVRFGSVEAVSQDSRVVQIERKEKFGFDKNGRGELIDRNWGKTSGRRTRPGKYPAHHSRAVNPQPLPG